MHIYITFCNTFQVTTVLRVITMARRRKFKIPTIPQTSSKCIRFPNDIIDQVEAAIQGKDCTFSAFVIEATRLALLDLEEEE